MKLEEWRKLRTQAKQRRCQRPGGAVAQGVRGRPGAVRADSGDAAAGGE